MSDLNIALILKFVDQATAPARAAMQNIQGAAERVERFGAAQMAQGAAMQEVARQNTGALQGQTMGMIGAGLAAYGLLRPSVELEARMSEVGAVTRATAEEQEAMRLAARELGRDTRFSALEAADGMKELGIAGLSTQDIITAMPGMLDLAAAAGENLGTTSGITTEILAGFQLEAAQMGRVADVMTSTFTSSKTDLQSLGLTMSYVAPIATGLGVDLETTAAMAGKLGDNGLAGEKGGTALRAILSRLAAPSTEARRALDDLGVSISDADGNMRALPEILAEMNVAMDGMGDLAQSEMRSVIFGMEAAGAAQILMAEAGSGALQNYIESLKETGIAAEVAARMSDNAKGALSRLRSITTDLALSIGDNLLPMLVEMIDRVIPLIGAASDWATENQELVTVLGWIAAGLFAVNIGALAAQWGFWLLFGWLGKARWAIGALIVVAPKLLRLIRALPMVFLIARSAIRRFAVVAASVAGTVAGWIIKQFIRLVGAALWVGRRLALAGRALLTNPIFLAIAAVAAAVYVIYDNWDGIVAYFTGKFDAVKAAFEDGFLSGLIALWQEFNIFTLMRDAAEGLFTYLTGWTFEQVGAALVGFIGFNPFTELRDRAEALFTYLTGWNFDQVSAALRAAFDIDLFAAGVALIESLIAGIWSLLTGLGGRIAAEVTSGLPGVFGGGDGDTSAPSGGSGTSRRPGRDSGGVVRPGFIYEINERNQEFFSPSVPGSVIRGSDLARGGASAGQPIQIGDINVYAASGMDPRAIATEIERQLRRAFSQRGALHDGGLT
ncbi:phage tail tape measure protein [Roseinatronobacter sp.]|uniref:phage tail tape measure protein n=1 Tax=Roseinatronobacter sp. TaxID=1945755 RepID=UPI0025E3AEBC|nr:phage tail tape measure protein [Roseibaca sp.]